MIEYKGLKFKVLHSYNRLCKSLTRLYNIVRLYIYIYMANINQNSRGGWCMHNRLTNVNSIQKAIRGIYIQKQVEWGWVVSSGMGLWEELYSWRIVKFPWVFSRDIHENPINGCTLQVGQTNANSILSE